MKRAFASTDFGALALACIASVALVWPLAASAEDAPAAGPGLVLRMKFSAGEQRRYRFSSLTQLDMPGVPAQLAGGMRIAGEFGIHVLSVNADGSAKVKVSQGPLEIEPNMGAFGEATKGGAACEGTITPTGKIILVAGSCGSSPQVKLLERAVSGLRAILPAKPVKPGESWKMPVELDLPNAPSGGSSKSNLRGDALLTFRKVEKVNGRNCAQISMTGALQLDSSGAKIVADLSATVSGESCFDLDAQDWATAKMQMQMKIFIGTPGQGMQGTSSSTMEYVRLPDGAVGGATGPAGGSSAKPAAPADAPKTAEPPLAPAPGPAP